MLVNLSQQHVNCNVTTCGIHVEYLNVNVPLGCHISSIVIHVHVGYVHTTV